MIVIELHLTTPLIVLFFSLFPYYFFIQFDGTTLTECQSYQVDVSTDPSTKLTAVPPFYLTAYVPGGIPTTTFLGSNLDDLQWTVNQPSGRFSILESHLSL